MIGFIQGLASLFGVGAAIHNNLKGASVLYNKGMKAHQSTNSGYTDFVKVARIEPIVMVDQSISHIPEMGTIMQSTLGMFSGYYLQMVNLIGCEVDGIKVGQVLGQLSPNRVPGFEAMSIEAYREATMEDYKQKLPMRSPRYIPYAKYASENHGGFGENDDDASSSNGYGKHTNFHGGGLNLREEIEKRRLSEAKARAQTAKVILASARKKAEADEDNRNNASNATSTREMNERLRNGGITDKEKENMMRAEEAELRAAAAGNKAKIAEMERIEKEATLAFNKKRMMTSSAKDIRDEIEAVAKMNEEDYKLFSWRRRIEELNAAREAQLSRIEQQKEILAKTGSQEAASKLADMEKNLNNIAGHIDLNTRMLQGVEAEYAAKLNHNQTKTQVSTGDEMKSLHESVNMSIGKVYNVTLKRNGQEATVPVSIRLISNVIPTSMLKELFTSRAAFDMDWKERFHGWRSGRLALWNDLILHNDLMDKRWKGVIRDQTDVMREINKRSSGNLISGMLGSKASIGTMTNIAIIAQSTMEEVEYELGGRMSNTKIRSAVFDSTNLMLLLVIDPQSEMVKLYTRGVNLPSVLSFKDMSAAKKKGDMDVTDILKAYMVGGSPQQL